jgi:hypothetical protein
VATIFTLEPKHTLAEDGVRVMVGIGFTLTCTVPGVELMQPNELVPLTEYVVVIVGQTAGPPFR